MKALGPKAVIPVVKIPTFLQIISASFVHRDFRLLRKGRCLRLQRSGEWYRLALCQLQLILWGPQPMVWRLWLQEVWLFRYFYEALTVPRVEKSCLHVAATVGMMVRSRHLRSRTGKIQPMREEDAVGFESIDEACASKFGRPSFQWASLGIDGRWLCFHWVFLECLFRRFPG